MKSPLSARFIAAAALAGGLLGAASAAQAHGSVYFSIGVPAAPVYVRPAPPVYVEPDPVYVQPRPIYVEPPRYEMPAPVYSRPYPPAYDSAYERDREWRREEWRHREWRRHHRDREEHEMRRRIWD